MAGDSKRREKTVLSLEPWQSNTLVLSTLVKLLLVPTYHSTDFEVHRHWLATTHTLPLSQWYFDETSQWTLDYPPFFAYFSWLLSVPARYWDPKIISLYDGLEYAEWSCKLYMRLTVIATEFMLAFALFALSRPSRVPVRARFTLPTWTAAAILLHPGLIIVDHIHFQYNGFLYGILLWSIWAAREQRPLLCAFLFSTLLNFKHIYVYIAPAFFVYLLQSYVIKGSLSNSVSTSGAGERLFTLAVITLVPFALSAGPLALSGLTSAAPAGPLGILAQMLRRLFPFSRGLNHAYWAANAWALYTFADRVLIRILRLTHLSSVSGSGAATRGIIGDVEFAVLPQISAGHCFLITVLCTSLLMVRLSMRPTYSTFVQSIALFGITSFMWGFHVHEKAILLGIIPLTLLASNSYSLTRKTLILNIAGTIGLFPLLFGGREIPIKIVYSLIWLLATPLAAAFSIESASRFPSMTSPTNIELLVHFVENIYLYGFAILEVFVEIVSPILTSPGTAGSGIADSTRVTQLVDSLSSAAAAVSSLPAAVFTAASDLATDAVGAVVDSSVTADGVASAITSMVDQASTHSESTEVLASTASTLEFLPLMLTSVYCAIGIAWVWLSLSVQFLRGKTDDDEDVIAENTLTSKKENGVSERLCADQNAVRAGSIQKTAKDSQKM